MPLIDKLCFHLAIMVEIDDKGGEVKCDAKLLQICNLLNFSVL